jgi:glycosyltransferase involved in cell wall biosynthesis
MSGNILADLPKKILLAGDRSVVRNYVTKCVVADEFNATRFRSLYRKEPEIIPYGIDCNFFSSGTPGRIRERYGLDKSFILLHVGILSPLKNQMESIRCLEKLVHDIPGISLILAGKDNGSYKTELEAYIRSHNLTNQVIFTGHVSREEIRDLYHACDVALFPVHEQGSWLSPFEALCAKKPVIVSPSFTAQAIFRNEGIGIVSDSFSRTVLDIYKNPGYYSAIATRGGAWTERTLSWQQFGSRMLKVFENATGEYRKMARKRETAGS